LCEELPKSGDVPMSPLPSIGGLGAIGGHIFNLKIDLGYVAAACHGHPHIGTCATPVARAQELCKQPKENTMNRHATLTMTATTLGCLAVGLSASVSLAQQKSLKEQLVGTWMLVSSDQVRQDGSKLRRFGVNPKGINVFDATGRFFIMVASADNSKIATREPNETNSEEVGGLIVESIAYYGTYTVNEVNVINLHLEASTFPNQIGTDQKRTITSLTADELAYSSSAAMPGAQVHQVWSRTE
jgi:Lipocalin-like domain